QSSHLRNERSSSMRKLFAIATFGLLVGATLPAIAASSGIVFRINVGTPNGQTTALCAKAETDGSTNPPLNISDSYSYTTSSCTTRRTLNTGWLGVRLLAIRDGGICGTSAWYNTTSSGSRIGHGGSYCSNPAGIQEFWTYTDSRMWRQSSSSYIYSYGL